jgi:hypothetical protein
MPSGRVAMFEGDISQRDREVDQVQIQIIELQILESPLAGPSHVLLAMVSIPEFTRHPEFVPPADTFSKDLTETLAHLNLVAVVRSAVEVSVADFGCFDRELARRCIGDFPKT